MKQNRSVFSVGTTGIAMAILWTTVLLAGCPVVEDDLFNDDDSEPDGAAKDSDGNESAATDAAEDDDPVYDNSLSYDTDMAIFDCDKAEFSTDSNCVWDTGAEQDSDWISNVQYGSCGLVQFGVLSPCDDGFIFMEYLCADGVVGKDGGDSSCKPAEVWKKYAEEYCGEPCDDPTPDEDTDDAFENNCSVAALSMIGICGDGFGYVEYTCADGTVGKEGDGVTCMSEDVGMAYAEKRCGELCTVAAEPQDSDVSIGCGLANLSVIEPCIDGFRYMEYACADGSVAKEGGDDSCKPIDVWEKYATEYCNEPCTAPIPPPDDTDPSLSCGTIKFTAYGECDAGFGYMDYMCADGATGTTGDGVTCISEEELKIDADKFCTSNCG